MGTTSCGNNCESWDNGCNQITFPHINNGMFDTSQDRFVSAEQTDPLITLCFSGDGTESENTFAGADCANLHLDVVGYCFPYINYWTWDTSLRETWNAPIHGVQRIAYTESEWFLVDPSYCFEYFDDPDDCEWDSREVEYPTQYGTVCYAKAEPGSGCSANQGASPHSLYLLAFGGSFALLSLLFWIVFRKKQPPPPNLLKAKNKEIDDESVAENDNLIP